MSVTTEAGKVGVPASVYVPVTVPDNVGLDIVGAATVLLVNVCASSTPTGCDVMSSALFTVVRFNAVALESYIKKESAARSTPVRSALSGTLKSVMAMSPLKNKKPCVALAYCLYSIIFIMSMVLSLYMKETIKTALTPLPGFILAIIDESQMENISFKGTDKFDLPQTGTLISMSRSDHNKSFGDEGMTYGALIGRKVTWAKYAESDCLIYDNVLQKDIVIIAIDKLRGYE